MRAGTWVVPCEKVLSFARFGEKKGGMRIVMEVWIYVWFCGLQFVRNLNLISKLIISIYKYCRLKYNTMLQCD